MTIVTLCTNNNNKFISSRQVQSVKQNEYKQRVLIIAYRFAIFVCVMPDMMVLARRVGAEMQLQRVTAG